MRFFYDSGIQQSRGSRACLHSLAPLCGIAIAFWLMCSRPPRTDSDVTIPVEYEKIYLAPIAGYEKLKDWEQWPVDAHKSRVLLSEFEEVHKRLLAEFHRCEKYGLFTMVDSNEAPTIIVTPVVNTGDMRGDTLQIAVSALVHHNALGRDYSYAIKGMGIADLPLSPNNAYRFYGLGLADYRRRFPYRAFAAPFCRQQ